MSVALPEPLATPYKAARHVAARPRNGEPVGRGVPPLVNGDHLSQPEFHRRYEAMPSHVRAELIGGIVYMASPLRVPHGSRSNPLNAVLSNYQVATPGVQALDNTTAILGKNSEPQPDVSLRLLPECGGQTSVDADEYLVGAPELVIEVAHSSTAIDLHRKKDDYRKAGVHEYLVLCIEDRQLRAFDLPADKAWVMPADGVFRSRVFPGLWIDGAAAAAGDARALHKTAARGVRSPEHKAFAKRMADRLTPKKKPAGKRRKG
jgi:Uma2 family endonuclease